MTTANYQIIRVTEMFSDISDFDKQLVRRDEYTMAEIYQGNSKSNYYLIPAEGKNGIKGSLDVLNSIVAPKHIPIEEEIPNYFQQNSAVIENIELREKEFIRDFFTNNSLNQDDFDKGNFSQIDKLLNSVKKHERYLKYAFVVGLLVGQEWRKRNDLIWAKETHHGYNRYYVLTLKNKAGETIDPWYRVVRELDSSKKLSFQKLVGD